MNVLLLLAMCFMVQKGFVYTISVDVYAFCLVFIGILPCILLHFAFLVCHWLAFFNLHLVAKRTAFSIKTHCI